MKISELWKVATSPRFMAQLAAFKRAAAAQGVNAVFGRPRPMMDDATAKTGFDEHYVYHTAWATRILRDTKPAKHIDISSSLFFVANASAILPIEHYDYRPPDLVIDNVKAAAADLLALPFADRSILSLSCMHVVEHVGLGRYGDPIDPSGDARAMAELSRVVAPGGQLLFVTPVGRPRIEFNAHRIYAYQTIIDRFPDFELVEFALIPDGRNGGGLLRHADPALVAEQKYGCGCFQFRRRA